MISYPIALIYIGFLGLIGISVYITQNPLCLLALLFGPSTSEKD